MKNLKMLFCIVVFSVIGFWGCDDSASSNEPDEKTSVDSSSSVCKDCDDESSSSAKKIESSAEKGVESSDDAETGKSSSSKGRVISSSEYTTLSNASSSNDNALETCSEEFEGMVRIRKDSSGTQLKWDCTDGFWILRSSSSATSSSSYFDMTDQFNSDIKYGTHTDSRDGVTYKTITIKYGYYGVDSLTFFAENLNFGKMVQSSEQQGDSTKYSVSLGIANTVLELYSWNT